MPSKGQPSSNGTICRPEVIEPWNLSLLVLSDVAVGRDSNQTKWLKR